MNRVIKHVAGRTLRDLELDPLDGPHAPFGSNEPRESHGQAAQENQAIRVPSGPPSRYPAVPPTSLLPAAKGSRSPVRPFRQLEVAQTDPCEAITPRQQEVLFCMVEGKSTKVICRELGMSEGTAKIHIGAIFRALRVHNRTQATLVALREGWIYPEMWSRS